MVEQNDYSSVIYLLAKMEDAPHEIDIITIDPNEILKNRTQKISYDQKSVIEIMNAVEQIVPFSPVNQSAMEKKLMTASEKKVQQKKQGMIGNLLNKKQKAAQPVPQSLSEEFVPPPPPKPVSPQSVAMPKPQQKPQVKPQPNLMEEQVNKTAAEMKKVVVSKPVPEQPKRIEKAVDEDNLVMPTLSIPDQISELEKINEGLDMGIFKRGQLDVIRDEIIGLTASLKKQPVPTDGTQKDLISLRNQRLQMVRARLDL